MTPRPTLVRSVAPVHDLSISTERELERQRSRSVQRSGLLSVGDEERFDRITRLAREDFGVDAAAITVIIDDRQYFKSAVGIDEPIVPRGDAFCAVTVADDRSLVVPDLTLDPLFSDNPFVQGPARLRFYAGVPVHGHAGWAVGALCLMHTAPREFDAADLRRLVDLAEQVEFEINVGTSAEGRS